MRRVPVDKSSAERARLALAAGLGAAGLLPFGGARRLGSALAPR